MRVFKASVSLLGLGLLVSSLSGCMMAAHSVLAPALDSAIQSQVERNATAESMGVSTAPYRSMDCAALTRTADTYAQEQYNPKHDALTSKYFGWQIDAINQVRAEKACSGDAAAQAAVPKVQLYGFCSYSPLGIGGSNDYDSYITPVFLYPDEDSDYGQQEAVEFNALLSRSYGFSNPTGMCFREDSLAKAEALREKSSADADFLVGNDDVIIAYQPTAQAQVKAPAPVSAAIVPATEPVAASAPVVTPVAPAAASGRGWLGAYLADPSPLLSRELGLQSSQGALVLGVAKNSAGASAGLRPLDVVQSMDGQSISNHQQLVQLLAAKTAGTQVTFQVWRARRLDTVNAILSATATPRQIEPGPGYCYVSVPAIGADQISWISTPFPVPEATPSGLQARGKAVGEQFRSFLLASGMANQVGERQGYGICNAGLGAVEQIRGATLETANSPALKAARIEFVDLVWAP
ncbi:MAG TPA: PDZ domain-containing protein [Pseudomonas sp.]|nr:PDZ domain-containing protein [Pseudomonas sp.]